MTITLSMSNTESRIPEIAVRRTVEKAAAVPCSQRYECESYGNVKINVIYQWKYADFEWDSQKENVKKGKVAYFKEFVYFYMRKDRL